MPLRAGQGWLAGPVWPVLPQAALPARLQSILSRLPRFQMDPAGRLALHDEDGTHLGWVPQLRTQWNLERSTRFERLDTALPWGIVLHWFGDLPEYELDIAAYLRGFDGMRPSGEVMSRTSAHFLVGPALPATLARLEDLSFGVLQTQAPDSDGTPYAAAHLNGMHGRRAAADSYFVQALDRVYRAHHAAPSLLNLLAKSPSYDDWNYQTLAVEITGSYYDQPQSWPAAQQIANTLGLVCALMRRYRIPASSLLGHLEMDPDKSDPGKVFMGLLRMLLGALALTGADPLLPELVFGPWLTAERSPLQAVLAYFSALHDYMVITARPDQVYAWETLCGYWLMLGRLAGRSSLAAPRLLAPLAAASISPADSFLVPNHHEGVDLYLAEEIAYGDTLPVRLAAPGECLFYGPHPGYCPGMAALFRHVQPDGAQFITVYGRMSQAQELSAELQAGQTYPAGIPLGVIARRSTFQPAYLHFAVAYGASWEQGLHSHPTPLLQSTRAQLLTRYMEPISFLNQPLPAEPLPPPAQRPRCCRPL